MIGSAALLGSRGCRHVGGRDPFTLGVASGEPLPDGVVLWTRLAPTPFEPGGGMPPGAVPVRWEIAEDERFGIMLRSGTTTADPRHGHAVHIEVGGLRPGRHYFYRFLVDGIASPVGRTQTAPLTMPDRLRAVFTSCQHYEAGYFSAHRHIAADDPDLVLFLGDYIYENDPTDAGVRIHLNPQPTDLDGYRLRYATYKLDPLLQAAHRSAPWIVIPDDHEVADNYGADRDGHGSDPATFLRRREAAYQAWYEHMPVRASTRPTGPAVRLYRSIGWGGLAQFQLLDDRQYRDPPVCQPKDRLTNIPYWYRPDCAARRNASRSMLGRRQERWLDDQLAQSPALWNILAQQTLMLPYRRYAPGMAPERPELFNLDTWSGYPAARDRIVRRWRDARTPNPLILSGDVHAFIAADHADPDDPRRIIASEFVGGSVTSPNHDPRLAEAADQEPGFRFVDGSAHGYGRLELTPDKCTITYRAVTDVRVPDSGVRDLARFEIENGHAGLQLV